MGQEGWRMWLLACLIGLALTCLTFFFATLPLHGGEILTESARRLVKEGRIVLDSRTIKKDYGARGHPAETLREKVVRWERNYCNSFENGWWSFAEGKCTQYIRYSCVGSAFC